MCRTAYSLLLHGKLHEVVQIAQQAALLGTTPVGLPHAMMCWAYIFHADALRQWNRLDEALDLALQGVRLSEQTETIVALYLGYTVLMRIYLARREMDAARFAFQKAEEALTKTYSPYRRDAYLIVNWVQFWLASGDLERAINWVQELAQHTSVHSPFAREREDVARARILLVQKMPTEALSLLEPLQVNAEKQERWSHVIEMKVLQALAHSMRNEDQEALTVLAQAVHLAESESYIRIFVDEGTAMATLLSRLREQKWRKGPTPYLDTLLAAFSLESMTHKPLPSGSDQPRGRLMEQPLVEPLSERELEVLHLVARGDSNQEIAEVLVIALDTVKRHVTHIFEKLGVNNRVQAVARARALGLLSDES
jgi:LuxR family maltose regulon positive regulatory protein